MSKDSDLIFCGYPHFDEIVRTRMKTQELVFALWQKSA